MTGIKESIDQRHTNLQQQVRGLHVGFVTVLGPILAAARTQEWTDAGMQVLAYRITYDITDPVVALDPAPDGQQEPRRASWSQELKKKLRPWR